MGFWRFWFVFKAERAAVEAELHTSIPVGMPTLITKNGGGVLERDRLLEKIEVCIGPVVTQNQASTRVANEFHADHPTRCTTTRYCLICVINWTTDLLSVPQL